MNKQKGVVGSVVLGYIVALVFWLFGRFGRSGFPGFFSENISPEPRHVKTPHHFNYSMIAFRFFGCLLVWVPS